MPVRHDLVVDRHRERRAQERRVGFDHRRQLEPLGHLGQDRHAELPAPVGDHEVDDFGRHLFGGADEIAFVFAIFGIDDDDDFAAGNGVHGRFNGGKTADAWECFLAATGGLSRPSRERNVDSRGGLGTLL